MSAVAVPPTKSFGARPPFVPPVVTGFNGDSGHEEEPYHRLLIEDVRRLLRTCSRTRFDDRTDPGLMLRLLDQRKRAIQRELDVHRMLAPEILPPALMAPFNSELWPEDEDLPTSYIRLLNELDGAMERIHAEIRAKNLPFPASEL